MTQAQKKAYLTGEPVFSLGMNTQAERVMALLKHRGLKDREIKPALSKVCGISYQSVREWFTGDTKTISAEHLAKIARYWRCNLAWLVDGTGSMEPPTETNVVPFAVKGEPLKLPLVSWVTAGNLCTAEDPYSIGDAEDWLASPFNPEYGDILLRVRGDSMFRPDGTGYADGEIIHVKTRLVGQHNDDVIARTPDGLATFKRLKVAPDGSYLEALNPAWPDRIIRVPEGTLLCGVVVGSWRERRR